MTAVTDILDLCHGRPGFLAGSAVAEQTYGKVSAHDDVDIFLPTLPALVSMGEHLLHSGATLDHRQSRVWYRWLRYDTNKWHTNSIKLDFTSLDNFDFKVGDAPVEASPSLYLGGVQVNLVYKLVGGRPTASLSQVLESFDFGLLATGYDLEDGIFRDLRSFAFPGYDIEGPLPLMPNKRQQWRDGFISQYNGLRQAGRYAKYHGYGYDLSLVKDDLVVGYNQAAEYLVNHPDQDKQTLGEIYFVIAEKIQADAISELAASYKRLNFKDSLDQIMEALE